MMSVVPPSPPDSQSPDSRASASGLELPARIGPYKILQLIGEGGMGVVYEAEQTGAVSRRVALKVLKPGVDTKEVVARFEAERQALAVMDHPNIAKIFDAGVSEEGRPFFVMELVRGIPLTEYCDNFKLDTGQRLELFVTVCQAVQHAHQKGVIHRDLKPSNMLVSERDDHPVPKIIDFGIAKAISQPLTERTLVTEYGRALGTPAYMSPEQAGMSGLDVDTRTDVYSLGVVLYELLVGRLPLDPPGVGKPAFLAQLVAREKDLPSPSHRLTSLGDQQQAIAHFRHTDVRWMVRELKGELEWMVVKVGAVATLRDGDRAGGGHRAPPEPRARGGSAAWHGLPGPEIRPAP
jgi:serine/threonine protein kinase